MIPKSTHQIWLGGDMPRQFRLYRNKLISLHRGWRNYLWTEDNVSELGLEPWQWEATTAAASSNIIRLAAVLKHGGIYLDMDIDVQQPLDPLLMHEAFAVWQSDNLICNAFFGAKPDHPWVRWQMDYYGDQRLFGPAHGCRVMTLAPRDGVVVLPTETAYPWDWNEPEDRTRIMPETLVAHHWEASWT